MMEIEKPEGRHIAFMDIETGGFNKAKHPIIEIGIVIVEPSGKYRYGWSSIIMPYTLPGGVEPEYTQEAETVHGINMEEMLAKGFPAQDVAQQVTTIMEHFNVNHVVGHCLKKFDWPRIKLFMEQFKQTVPDYAITDTMDLAKKKLPGRKSYSLQNIRKDLEITQKNTHRALSDAYVCFEVWSKIR